MENRDRCPSCGALILPGEKFCKQCGAPLTGGGSEAAFGAQTGIGGGSGWRPGMRPVTIEQLKEFCAYNEMPLEKMRFFLDMDYRQPRAFGIYQDGGRYIVYKNKADGSRAVRYDGPDEAYAVGELYDKLLDECHNRDIWPDGKPEGLDQRRKAEKRRRVAVTVVTVLLILTVGFIYYKLESRKHDHDGYYRFDDVGIYYCYGGDWYYDDDDYDWTLVESAPYRDYDALSDYYIGDSYDNRWGYSDFTESRAWDRIQEENRTSSSDYSSWDSGSTDWSSDW